MNQSKFRSRALRMAAAVATVTGFALGTDEAEAQQCISAEAKAAFNECPEGALKASVGNKPTVSVKTAPQAVSLKKRDDKTKPDNPTDVAAAAQRDERKAKMQKKSRQLLVTEIQNLESLFADTKMTAADKPDLARRLAEGYVELEAAAVREQTEAEIRSQDASRKNDSDTAKKENESASKAKQVVAAARKSAIKYYTFLKDKFPKWCQQPNAADPSKSQGCGDEVLYYLAYEYEQAKDFDNARKVYFELVENWKTSKYRPNAYLAFGELFFQEAQGDPSKWVFAQQSYEEVIKLPPPDNKVYGYALYKLGYVHWNIGEFEKAVDAFKKVIDYGVKFSNLPNAPQLAVSARRDIIPVYALWGDAKKAYNFFKPLSGDTGQDNTQTFKMMDELGLNYLDTGHYDEGIALYTDLMSRDKGPKYCEYHGHISEATMAKKSGDKEAIVKVIARQFEVMKEFKNAKQPEDAVLKCGNVTAGIASETAMSWHLEAVGSGNTRGTGETPQGKVTMKLAADLYEKVVQNFQQADFEKFTFPRILKDDWPNIFKIQYAMADLLWYQKDWERCGPAFDAVVAADPKGPQAAESAYAAVLCYQNIYLERHKGGEDRKGTGQLPGGKEDKKVDKDKFKPKEFAGDQKQMITAFNRYVCYIEPDKNNAESMEKFVEIKFARARTYFEARHWEEAALGFRDLALNHASHEIGIFAGQLYLESLNILSTHLEKSSCLEDISKDVPEFVKLYCATPEKAKENEENCSVLFRIQRDIERIRAEALVKEADAGGAGALEKYRTAAELYMELWKKYGKDACMRDDKEGCARNEEVLYNAAKAYQAARLLAKAISVRKILIDPQYHLHETPVAKEAVLMIGRNYQAIAVYDEAAGWFERYAAENGGSKDKEISEQAARALSDAVVLRLGLGQLDQAIKDSDQFQNMFKAKASQAAQIAFAIGAYYIEREDWGNARKRLESAMKQIDSSASIDVKIQAHAMLARAHDKVESRPQARTEYDKVRSSWTNPEAMINQINEVFKDEPEASRQRRVGKMLEAVGEAFFYFGEEKKAVVDKIIFPEYKGSGERKDVEEFIGKKVVDWQKKKRAAIEDADREYQKILGLQPEPPPRWVIAAAARVGQMKGKFVAEFRAAPIPKEWKQNGPSPYGDLLWEEIRGTYYAKLDEVSEPDKQAAKGAYKECLDRSVRFQYFDEFSRSCEQWLSKTYPAEYHLIDEFRSAPNRLGTGINERAVPVNTDGTAFVPLVEEQKEAPKDAGTKDQPNDGNSKETPAAKDSKGATTNNNSKSKEDDALNKAKKK